LNEGFFLINLDLEDFSDFIENPKMESVEAGEKNIVEKELSWLMEVTLRLEDELNRTLRDYN